ncbi:putative acyl-CoA dehydrogenase [Aspergillus udagawae]|uniref:Acyl-CoA dehydrogenase n=1 Tax=Aspergillus udagawae TaxID=91492 RepID=A0ABQ1BE57_9EURO|nr:putative acyl-CoA dehydrogenase [Aspergillus udagawae]
MPDGHQITLVFAPNVNTSFAILGQSNYSSAIMLKRRGHKAASGSHIKYTNLRVPVGNVLCAPGTGAPIGTQSSALGGLF